MRINTSTGTVKLWLSAEDTRQWACKPGVWPCSFLAGKTLYAEFEAGSGDLIDFTVDGRDGVDVDCDEFNAITSDFLEQVI